MTGMWLLDAWCVGSRVEDRTLAAAHTRISRTVRGIHRLNILSCVATEDISFLQNPRLNSRSMLNEIAPVSTRYVCTMRK